MRNLLISTVALLGLMVMGVPGAAAAILLVDDNLVECPTASYTSIQAAINAAISGVDTIQVCPGTYMENVVLFKSLILRGAQASVDARGRVASESTVTPLIATTRTLELRTGSAGSIIDGFTFLGGSRAIESTTGPIDGLQLLNNRIRGFTGNGVFLNDKGINITVDQNDIDGTFKVGSGALFHLDQDNFDGFHFTNNRVVNGQGTPPGSGTGFFVDGTRNVDAGTTGARVPLFSLNYIDNNGTGVNLGRKAWGDGAITGNTFSNNLFDGLQGGPKNSAISQNTFDSNDRNGLTLTGFGGTTDSTRGAQGNTITQNCFTRNGFVQGGTGIFFSNTQAAGTISTNIAHQNNIFGNAMGARYPLPGTETIDATLNWWGAADGPGPPDGSGSGDGVDGHGQINFTPFLTSPAGGTPCIPTPPPPGKVTGGGEINVTNGRGSFGFNAKQDGGVASGHLNYLNHVTGAHLDCTVTVITQLTTTMAKFSGSCSSDSAASSFTAEVQDNGEPGKGSDKFKITYGTNTEGDTIISGNIQIHK